MENEKATENTQKTKQNADFNHEHLGAYGLDMSCDELNDKVSQVVKSVKKDSLGRKSTSKLAESLEKSLSPREMTTALALMIARQLSEPSIPKLPSFEESFI